ncbi:TrkH family potassium uptake protein [Oceaniovalibus guishaninsula]|nr:potassium transporter TrkG [Oceaniovalibus guishaninsula]
MLALIYIAFIAMGTILLMAPLSLRAPIGWGDALFTATSAVTVTGLVVVDPGTTFTFFGQAVIAVLIQLGGLGLMTFAVLLLTALGIPIGIPQRIILREEVNQTSLGNLTALVRIIFAIALICEGFAAVALSFVFVPQFGWAPGVWHAVFHSVSAFNNAGFALFPDSLSAWVANPVITIVIPASFIFGGLGFVVIGEVFTRRSWRRLSLHSKLMLVGTGVLILASWLLFAALEWTNPRTLGALDGISARVQASFFQAVTPRTAGFNTLPTGEMRDATALMTIGLMLIGGGSTSTAGGIKVTTAIVLILGTLAFFRRRTVMQAFGRSLGTNEIMKVMALTTISITVVFLSFFILTVGHDGSFLVMGFEVASAFGTVGMSMGATAQLDPVGRAVIIVIMFLGRVGPLALGFFLATRSLPRVRYPAGQVYLG